MGGFGLVKGARLVDLLDLIMEFIFVTSSSARKPCQKRGVESLGVSWKLPEA